MRTPYALRALAACLALGACGGRAAVVDPPASAGAPASEVPSPPKENFLSSLTQAFKQDFDNAVVRGHFEVGSPPDAKRYYCLVDAKTGKGQPNGVAGQPVARSDGMTGIKVAAVSLYGCASAEEQGSLVTTGYVLKAGAAAKALATPEQKPVVAPALPGVPRDKIDVAGVKLGMSLDEVRAVLKSKKLPGYYEATETLSRFDSSKGVTQPIAGGRFVNVLATWTAVPAADAGAAGSEDGEAYEVMFTPLPGKERAMAIVHSVGYSAANAVRETVLDGGLVKKYGGLAAGDELTAAPTWRIQNGGTVQMGDSCERRALFGGLGRLDVGNATRRNLALNTSLDEFQFQIDHCGVAIVTADHITANPAASREERMVKRFTVTAYSPSIGLEGAMAAAQTIQRAGETLDKAGSRSKDPPLPNL